MFGNIIPLQILTRFGGFFVAAKKQKTNKQKFMWKYGAKISQLFLQSCG